MKAHTLELEFPVKLLPSVSVSPFYRFHSQNAIDHFAPYLKNNPSQIFYTSDFDLSALKSHFFGMGFRLSPPKGVAGVSFLNLVELRYGHYTRDTGLQSDMISLHLKFK